MYKNHSTLPLGLLSLGTILKKNGYEVQIIDFNHLFEQKQIRTLDNYKGNINEMTDYILSQEPQIIGFYTMCNSYHNSILLSQKIKYKKPDVKIMLGGPQASFTAKSSLKAFPWIDVIGIGECETNILNITKALEKNTGFEHIPGVAFRKSNKIVCNTETDLIQYLDDLPFIDYSFVDINSCKIIPIDAGRGCPFNCTYCSTKTFWKKRFRLKSSKRLVDEITYIKETYGKDKFSLVHDLFTANKTKVIEFCNMLIERKLDNIEWGCSARIDTLDEEIISCMRSRGCKHIYLGIETGSPRMQKLINKNLNLNELWDKIDLLKKYNYEITLSFIYGFPDETLEDIQETLDMIRVGMDRKVKSVQLHLLTILPGTELHHTQKNNLQFSEFYSDIAEGINISECKDMFIKNPEIFPQFYMLNSELVHQLLFLDRFINFFYSTMSSNISSTYQLLMLFYNNDLLKLFFDFRKYIPDFATRIFFRDDYFFSEMRPKDLILNGIDIFENFINQAEFGKYSIAIREVFKFESDIYRFLNHSTQSEEVLQYDTDVLKIKKYDSYKEAVPAKHVTLKFSRLDNGNLKIKRIA